MISVTELDLDKEGPYLSIKKCHIKSPVREDKLFEIGLHSAPGCAFLEQLWTEQI